MTKQSLIFSYNFLTSLKMIFMKRIVLLLTVYLFTFASTHAQIVSSKIQSTPLQKVVQFPNALKNTAWNTALRTSISKPHSFGNVQAIKDKNLVKQKTIQPSATQSNKTLGASPVIGNSFRGNDLNSFTPSDNDIAISNDGIIVSVINQNIEVYAANGSQLLGYTRWNDFIDDSTLTRGKYDPRVLYDPYHDRFITCILHAPADTLRSSIVIAFSKTNDPLQGWNIYNLTGNPIQNGGWTDFPSIGINEHELFLNANLFQGSPAFSYLGTYIQQIDLASAYAGSTLQNKVWSGFDATRFITLSPAPDGQLKATGAENMRFAMLNPGMDSLVYMFNITGKMNDPSATVTTNSYPIPTFTACARGYIKDPNSTFIDSITTGSSWVQNAFTVDNQVHFTFSADANGHCGVHYGRIDLDEQTASYTTYSEPNQNLAYPAIASIGFDGNDKTTAMVYLKSSLTVLPEVVAITIDDNMNWSAPQTVKQGDTIIDILGAGNNPNGTERWGDYSGITRKYNATLQPEAWLFGCYSANTSGRLTSWANWIAQLKTADFPVGINETPTNQAAANVYPNPTASDYKIAFDLPKESMVELALYDMSGRYIKQLFKGTLPTSKNELAFNRNALANGQYFIQLSLDGELQTKKLVIVE